MVKKLITTVLDIGARYGIHPTWKNFTGEKNFILLEPDEEEFKRLKIKYKAYKDIKVFNYGISDRNEKIKLNIFNNPAMSSVLKRRNISPLLGDDVNCILNDASESENSNRLFFLL